MPALLQSAQEIIHLPGQLVRLRHFLSELYCANCVIKSPFMLVGETQLIERFGIVDGKLNHLLELSYRFGVAAFARIAQAKIKPGCRRLRSQLNRGRKVQFSGPVVATLKIDRAEIVVRLE